ncbi:hypothetical protein [Streptomyces sp. TLI_185]|uniref:hypothetical protein n=1 Tax=Streptomyces sp. TLI_185 TaxID=2485151 RepID=UPI000F4D5FD6|nr:hypothetical protein [Streptomyces sp. TLI_185]
MVSARWLAYDDEQTYVHEAAEVVADALYDPVLGACEPAVAGLRVLRNPAREVLEERIREAFAAASRAGATLVLYLIGHGSSDFDDDLYHFIPADHPLRLLELPDRGCPLGARLRAQHSEFRYQRPEGHDPVARLVREHRRVALLGPSGSGKSATLHMTAIDRIDPDRAGPNPDRSLPATQWRSGVSCRDARPGTP